MVILGLPCILFSLVAQNAFGQRRAPHGTAAPKPVAKPVEKDPLSLWRDSQKGDVGALGGRIEGRNIRSAWSFKVSRIIDDETAEIHSEVIVEMTKEKAKDNGATCGETRVKWDFLLKSPAAVKKLHEDQSLAKIPGQFIHQGRKCESGHSIDIVADQPPNMNPATAEIEYRTWTDVKGRRIEALFEGQSVTLKKRDRNEVTIPLSKLSDEDREWIRHHEK